MNAFAIEGKTLPSKTIRILNLVSLFFEGQPSWKHSMPYNYRKTKFNSLLFKRSLCVKNNENNKKNIFTFYHCSSCLVDDFITPLGLTFVQPIS